MTETNHMMTEDLGYTTDVLLPTNETTPPLSPQDNGVSVSTEETRREKLQQVLQNFKSHIPGKTFFFPDDPNALIHFNISELQFTALERDLTQSLFKNLGRIPIMTLQTDLPPKFST